MGHVYKDSTGPDRTKCCRRCGATGHFALNCGAEQSVASAFSAVLTKEGSQQLPHD